MSRVGAATQALRAFSRQAGILRKSQVTRFKTGARLVALCETKAQAVVEAVIDERATIRAYAGRFPRAGSRGTPGA